MMDGVVRRHLRSLAQYRAASTVYSRGRALVRLEANLGVPLLAASAGDLAGWRERLGLGLSPISIAAYVSHVKRFYAWAVDEALLPVSPAEQLRVPPVPRLLPHPIEDDELRQAVLAAPQPVRLMLVLAGWAGLRAKELALLRRQLVRERRRPPVLQVAWDATKGMRERLVPLHPLVVDELAAFGLPRSGLVFRRRDGHGFTPAGVSRVCNCFLHDLGITETLHGGRHRFATVLYQQTGDVRLVQEMIGHSSLAATQIYTKVSPAAAAAAVAALPGLGLRIAG